MTLQSETVKHTYSGDGATASFAVDFVFWDVDDLKVIHTDANDVETVWTRGTQYTVTRDLLTGATTGDVVVETTPVDYTPASGETLTIISNLPDTQDSSFPLGGSFPSATVEQQLDQTTRIIQQKKEALDRSLKFPTNETSASIGDIPILTDRKSKFLAFDSSGIPTSSAGTGADSGLRTDLAADDGSTLVTFLQSGTGTVARTVQDKERDIISIFEYMTDAERDDVRNRTALIDVTSKIKAAETDLGAGNGGNIHFPLGKYHVSELDIENTFVELVGEAPSHTYQSDPTGVVFSVTTGVYGIRFKIGSAQSAMRHIALISNGLLSATPPHAITTAGVEYGIIMDSGVVTLENVTASKFQHGCVQTGYGNSNLYERCSFVWNTKTGFGVTSANATAFALAHPNLTAPSSYITNTVYTMRDCTIRRNGWGMILRSTGPIMEGINVIESNYFGGLLMYKGTNDSTPSIRGRIYLEGNWIYYDETQNYDMTVNTLLLDTAGTPMPWTDGVTTASNDAGYQLYAMSISGGTTTQGPSSCRFEDFVMVLGSTGATAQKGMYLKQSYLFKFFNTSCSGGDQANAVRMTNNDAGFYSVGTQFWDYNGTLPATLGSRGTHIRTELSASSGGLSADVNSAFRGLAGTAVSCDSATTLAFKGETSSTPEKSVYQAIKTRVHVVNVDAADPAENNLNAGDDSLFDNTAANNTEQSLSINTMIPAFAEVISAQLRCIESVAGSGATTLINIDVGTTSGGAQLITTGTCNTAGNVLTLAAGAGPIRIGGAASHVYINVTPTANWDTLTAGRWALFLTYIDYDAVRIARNA